MDINKGLTKAQKEWAKNYIPPEAVLVDAQRIDTSTIRIMYYLNEKLCARLAEG